MSGLLLDDETRKIWAPLECAPIAAYLLREVPNDFILEAVNEVARDLAPGLVNLLGCPCASVYADQPEIIEAARTCVREKRTLSLEGPVRRHDRMEARPQRMVYVHVPPERLVIFSADVNFTDNLSAALRESDERYRSLLASLPDAVLLRGTDERVLTCNDAAVRLFGHKSASEVLGQTNVLAPGVVVKGENGEAIAADAFPSQRVIRSGQPVHGELFRVEGPGNVVRFVRVSAQPLRTRSGNIGGSVSVYVDETERIAAQRAEREAAARLEIALESAAMGVWDWTPGAPASRLSVGTDPDGGSDDSGLCSTSIARLFDLPATCTDFGSLLTHVHPEDTSGLLAWAQATSQRADGQPSEHEFRILGRDGKVRWAHTRGRPQQSPDGLRLIGTLADVSARKAIENSLRESRHLESVGRLAGGVAHDFNNLLTAMLGALDMLADVCPVTGREDLAIVRAGAERARDLTAQLLAFARKQPIILDAVDVGELLSRVERLLRPLLGSRIELRIHGLPGLTVRADATQLQQVLINLAANARDAMPEGGRLEMHLGTESDPQRGERVVLEVSDSSPGIAADSLPNVFDPFFSDREGGSGLALASSYGIIKQHGGDISVESQVGAGTRFRIALPRATGPSSLHPPTPVPDERKACILVVDDEDSVRKTTCRLLKSLGYEVLAAEDGPTAIDVAKSHPGPIDVLLCDVAMPGQSGPEVAEQVLAIRSEIRVLFVSGYPEGEEDVVSTHGFLQKPYTRATLGEKLASLWERRPSVR